MYKLAMLPLLLVLLEPSARAQVIYTDWMWHEWEATPFAGGSFVGKDRTFETPVVGFPETRDVGLRYGKGYMLGVNIRQNLGDNWAADLQYTFANQPLEFTNLIPGVPSFGVSNSIHNFSYNGTYQFRSYHHHFNPYVRAGGGASLFFVDGSSKDAAADLGFRLTDSWKPSFSYGGGFRYLFDDYVGLTFDARDTITGVPSYGLPRTAQVVDGVFLPGFAKDGIMHNVQVNFGITFRWDDWYH